MIKSLFRSPWLLLGIILIISIAAGSSHFCQPCSLGIISPQNAGGDLFVGEQIKMEPESPDFSLVQENTLVAKSCPEIVSSQTLASLVSSGEEAQREITEYVVQSGDNLSSIASSFNISLNTLLWANDLNQGSVIRAGQKLTILPVSGTLHLVQSGDTIGHIAQTYKVDSDEIISFNDLSSEGKIFLGDLLIIPGGVEPPKASPVQYTPLASSYFICPIAAPCRITQGLHWYNAIDFAHEGYSCGEPVFAAAGGEIQKTGYDATAGNYVRILHPNGVVTLYGHLQTILVSPGEKVYQGQRIGLIGYTGRTIPAGPTGCHLHFGVRGASNPFAY